MRVRVCVSATSVELGRGDAATIPLVDIDVFSQCPVDLSGLVIKIPTVCVCSLLHLAHLHCLPTIGPAAVALVAAALAWRTRHG